MNHCFTTVDSNNDVIWEDEMLCNNKEEKINDMTKVNNLFRRLRSSSKFLELKNIGPDEIINKKMSDSSNKDEEEKIKENNMSEKEKNNENDLDIDLIKNKNNNEQKIFDEKKNDIIIEDKKKQIKIDEENKINTNQNIIKEFEIKKESNILTSEEKELSSMDYESYLKEQDKINKNKINESIRETFCLGFFLTSFNINNPTLIEKTELLSAPCEHKSCSIFKSLKPEIIMRYPLKDTDLLKISNFSSGMCFPSGIKLCYCENENKPKKMEDFMNIMTNDKGERYYIMTYHFYLRMEKKEFDQKCEQYPLKLKLKEMDEKIKGINYKKMDENTFNFFEELKICKEFEYRNNVYIPYCLALISKYPYIKQMKKSITCIYKFLENQIMDNNLELNELIMYLIHSIPTPNMNSIIKFPLPYLIDDESNKNNENIITLKQDINIFNNNYCEILKIFRIKNILRIFRLLLFEKKIIFLSNDYSKLSNIMNSFLSLIYPFKWHHMFIPILSISMLKYLESFMPFFIGIHSSFLPYIKEILLNNSDKQNQIYLVYLEDDKIRISDYLRGNMKKLSKSRYLHNNLTNLPFWINLSLSYILNSIKLKMKNIKKEEIIEFNNDIQNSFTEIFVEMFSDYDNYIYRVGDDYLFNKEQFLSKKSCFDKSFYKEFVETQMFLQFKQDMLNDGYKNFKLKISKRNSGNKELEQTALKKTCTVINKFNRKKNIYRINHKFKNMIKIDNSSINKENYIIKYIKDIENEKFDYLNCIIYLDPVIETIGTMVKEYNIEENSSNDEIEKKASTELEKRERIKKYAIKSQIKEYLIKIFKSTVDKKEEEFKDILKYLTTEKKYRKYFIKLISKNLSKILILPKESFDLLYQLIYETLEFYIKTTKPNDDVLIESVLLIKSLMNYGKKEKSKIITLFDLCVDKLNENVLIYEERFWEEWYIYEIHNYMNLDGIFLDDVKYEIMISISKTMKELKIDKSIIALYTNNLMKKYFVNDINLIQKIQKYIDNI